MPIAILSMFMNSVGKLLIIRRAERNFRFVSKNFDRHGIVNVTDEERAERLTRGTLGDFPILAATKKTDFLTDFLRYTYSSDMTDSYCRRAVPLTLLASAIVAAVITFFAEGGFFSAESAAFGFSCIFSDVTAGRDDILYPIENYSFEEGMGMCGWINNKRVLFGNRELMTSHNIEGVPSRASESESKRRAGGTLPLSIG